MKCSFLTIDSDWFKRLTLPINYLFFCFFVFFFNECTSIIINSFHLFLIFFPLYLYASLSLINEIFLLQLPTKHLLVFKTSWRSLRDMPWKRLQHIFSVTTFPLPSRLQNFFKEDVFKTSSRRLGRSLQDVFKLSSRRIC